MAFVSHAAFGPSHVRELNGCDGLVSGQSLNLRSDIVQCFHVTWVCRVWIDYANQTDGTEARKTVENFFNAFFVCIQIVHNDGPILLVTAVDWHQRLVSPYFLAIAAQFQLS